VSAILSTSALASYKIDEFLVVLASLYRFIELGEAFSGAPSEHLRRSIKEQSKAYFENLHRARMEGLLMNVGMCCGVNGFCRSCDDVGSRTMASLSCDA
jgi:hypothetical protein